MPEWASNLYSLWLLLLEARVIPYTPQTYPPPAPGPLQSQRAGHPAQAIKVEEPALLVQRPGHAQPPGFAGARRVSRRSHPRSPRKRPLRHAGFRLVLHGGQHLPEASGRTDLRSRAAGYFLGPGLKGRFTAASQRRSKEWSELRRPGALRIASYWCLPLLLPKVSRKVPTLRARMACPHAHTQEMGIKV